MLDQLIQTVCQNEAMTESCVEFKIEEPVNHQRCEVWAINKENHKVIVFSNYHCEQTTVEYKFSEPRRSAKWSLK